MENINEFLISQDIHLGNNWVCADLKGNVRTIDLPKLLTAFADEQTKPLKEEIGMLKLDLGLADIEIKNTKRTLGQCESALLDREDSLSLAKKENEELAQQLSDKELEYVNEVGKTYNLIDVIKLSKAELTSVKEQLTENKNNLLSVCEYFASMENAELNHKQLETFLINLGGKLNESLNNYKK